MKLTAIMKTGAAVVAAFALSSAADAALISGLITFGGGDGTYAPGHTGVASITEQPDVTFATGDFSSTVGQTATFTAPWSFNSGSIANFWSVGDFTFDLTSSTLSSSGGLSIVVIGTGTITSTQPGFDPTPATFEFTSNPGTLSSSFSFTAASNTVPDGGTSIALLGVSLLGLAGARRKFGKR